MTRARVVVAALVAALTGVLVCGVLAGWHRNADVALFTAAAVGYIWFIVVDSGLRGRSGAGWLLLCILLAPIGLLAFLFVSVRDRVQGRRGVESYWAPGVRWCYLVAVGMAAAALALAAVQVKVAGPQLSGVSTQPGYVHPDFGSCDSSPPGLLLGNRPGIVTFYAGQSPADQAQLQQFGQRCVEKAGRRMVASTISLAGAFALAMIAAVNGRRRRPVPPPPAPVSLAA